VKTLDGITPLHVAVVKSHHQIAIRLIAAGANVNAKDNDNETPLHVATMISNKSMVELLKKHGATK